MKYRVDIYAGDVLIESYFTRWKFLAYVDAALIHLYGPFHATVRKA